MQWRSNSARLALNDEESCSQSYYFVRRRNIISELNYSRREFLAFTGLALAVPAISAISAAETPAPARCLLYDDQGQPLPAARFERFHLCDQLMRPFPTPIDAAAGEVRFTQPSDPAFRIGMPLSVPGFGQVFVYADDGGAGYTGRSLMRATALVLNYAFARDRMATVRKLVTECGALGVTISPESQRRSDSAQVVLDRATGASADRTAQARASMESLRDSLYADEMLVVARAQRAIARQAARPGFLFGCNRFGLASGYPEALNLFQALFNYTTIPIFGGWVEPQKGHPDSTAFEAALNTLIGTTILPKGHPGSGWSRRILRNGCRTFLMTKPNGIAWRNVREAISRYRHRVHIDHDGFIREGGSPRLGYLRLMNLLASSRSEGRVDHRIGITGSSLFMLVGQDRVQRCDLGL
jgi:hypothetical protein